MQKKLRTKLQKHNNKKEESLYINYIIIYNKNRSKLINEENQY